MTTNNEENGEYVCEACGKAFEAEAALERHVHDVGLVY